ncbi:MAG: class I SAM-dependent methyltransferase [Flavobacteriia bacterium]|nr:class I SAM-dependent methyltransferase [Flavobacteriia bacterium]
MNWKKWNAIRYTLYAPIYNVIKPIFKKAREFSISKLNLEKGSKVLIVGGGTGLDLPFFPPGSDITFTDFTPEMVRRAKKVNLQSGVTASFQTEDGANLSFQNEYFDAVVLHLIVAVIPDPQGCIDEANRVLKSGGEVVILDKFMETEKPSFGRRILNPFIRVMFTDLNRRIEDFVPENWQLLADEGVLLGRTFRVLHLRKR